jgi:hypothetical protein
LFSDELKALILKVLTSWQVIAVTVVIVLYFLLVFYVGRVYHRHRIAPVPKIKKTKKKTPESEDAEEVAVSDDDNLGIEEAE